MLKAKATEHLGLIGVVVTIAIIALVGHFVGMERLKELVVDAGPLAPLAFIVLKASTVIIAPLSGGPVYPLVGALFGYWPGILYTIIGDFLGYTGAFFIARFFGKRYVEKLIAKNERGLLARIVEHVGTVRGLFHACVTSFAMPELICYGAGLSKIPYSVFIAILMPLGIVASSVLVYLGSMMGEESIVLSLALPIVGTVIIGGGLWLFLQGIKEKK